MRSYFFLSLLVFYILAFISKMPFMALVWVVCSENCFLKIGISFAATDWCTAGVLHLFYACAIISYCSGVVVFFQRITFLLAPILQRSLGGGDIPQVSGLLLFIT